MLARPSLPLPLFPPPPSPPSISPFPRCPWYHDGSACEDESFSVACLNDCSQRGDCEGGVCQCQAGFFGADCSLYYNEELRLR
ncbi:unnamed protein product [Closterium sp. NIES-53]